MIDPIAHLISNFNEFQQGQASFRRLRAIKCEPQEPADHENAVSLSQLKGQLIFEQVSFGYDPAQPILHQLNLHVQAGQVLALVGPSGAGKSTIFSFN